MSTAPKPPPSKVEIKSAPPPKTKSGEMAAVKTFRAKLDSIREGTLPALEAANARAARAVESIAPPSMPDDEAPTVVRADGVIVCAECHMADRHHRKCSRWKPE